MQNYIRIKPSWQIFIQNDTLIFYNSYGKEISFLLSRVMRTVLKLLATHITEAELTQTLEKTIAANKKDTKALIEKMKTLHILENYLPKQIESTTYQKFQTQLSFFDLLHPLPYVQSKIEQQLKLKATKIMVIGCGGIGCALLQSLVAAGIEQITIVDGDTVELSDLSKQQLLTHQDIDIYKTLAAQKQLLRMAPDAVILPITTFVNSDTHLAAIITETSKPDFIFLSADEPNLPLWLNVVCKELSIPFMKVSYLGATGFIGPLVTPEGKDFSQIIDTSHIEQLQNELINLHNKNHKHASAVFANSIIANMAIAEFLKFILNIGEVKIISRRLYFNFETMGLFFDDDLERY